MNIDDYKYGIEQLLNKCDVQQNMSFYLFYDFQNNLNYYKQMYDFLSLNVETRNVSQDEIYSKSFQIINSDYYQWCKKNNKLKYGNY